MSDMEQDKDEHIFEERISKHPNEHCADPLKYSFSQNTDVPPEHNINDCNYYLEDEPYTAPVEVLAEFLSTLMTRNYKSALYYCKLILLYEPDNEIAQDFYPLIQEKMHLDNSESDENGETDESRSTTRSESSTEYFSSSSVGSGNLSSCSSFSGSEEDCPSLG